MVYSFTCSKLSRSSMCVMYTGCVVSAHFAWGFKKGPTVPLCIQGKWVCLMKLTCGMGVFLGQDMCIVDDTHIVESWSLWGLLG